VLWLLLIVPGVLGGAALAAIGRRVLAHSGEPDRRARIISRVAGVTAALTWAVFGFDQLIYGVRENGPTYYPFSAYMEYRHALAGPAALLAGLGYALLPAAALIAAGLAYRRLGWVAAAALVALGSIAIALPAVVPGTLPRSEYGKDAVFHLSRGGPFSTPADPRPTVCFDYSVEGGPPGPSVGKADPELCLALRPNDAARRLLGGEFAPVEGDHPSVYDLGIALNDMGVRPYDKPPRLEVDGLETEDAHWTGEVG
jgi:hypothetical protein